MLEITNLRAFNFEGALRGMRQPFKNTMKSDSLFGTYSEDWAESLIDDYIYDTYAPSYDTEMDEEERERLESEYENNRDDLVEDAYKKGILYGDGCAEIILIGPKDLDLAQRLIKAGSPHDKFMRQIFVSMDINAPLYW